MDMAEAVYRLSRMLPKEERYGLISQLTQAASSVPANIAEGFRRGTRKDYANFISMARGSCAEVETFLLLVERVALAPEAEIRATLEIVEEVARMLTRLRVALLQAPRPQALTPRLA
jgi:four helix bundle protein